MRRDRPYRSLAHRDAAAGPREFIRAHGQVPRTEDLSANPGEAAWQLLAQVLDVITEAEAREEKR